MSCVNLVTISWTFPSNCDIRRKTLRIRSFSGTVPLNVRVTFSRRFSRVVMPRLPLKRRRRFPMAVSISFSRRPMLNGSVTSVPLWKSRFTLTSLIFKLPRPTKRKEIFLSTADSMIRLPFSDSSLALWSTLISLID